jgi:hypothetical protein
MCLQVSYKEKYEEFFFCILEATEERSPIRSWIRIRSVSQRYGPADPAPYQNVTNPQHCRKTFIPFFTAVLLYDLTGMPKFCPE